MATIEPSDGSSARWTTPCAPSPSLSSKRYRPRRAADGLNSTVSNPSADAIGSNRSACEQTPDRSGLSPVILQFPAASPGASSSSSRSWTSPRARTLCGVVVE